MREEDAWQRRPGGATPTPSPEELLQQLFGGVGAAGGPGAQGGAPGAFPGMFGAPGAPGAAGGGVGGMGGLAGMLGAGGQKKATDSFFTDRLQVLQRLKRPVLVAFFAYCLYRGWVGRFGFIMGAMGSSYFDMLAVPLRVLPDSPLQGKAFFVAQIWVDSGFRLVGWLINLARGKAKIPSLQDLTTPPGGGAGGAAASPWGAAGGLGGMGAAPPQPSPVAMPTARTTASPPPPPPQPPAPSSAAHPPESQGPPSRKPPEIVDADVTFLD